GAFWSQVIFDATIGNKEKGMGQVEGTRVIVPQPAMAQLGSILQTTIKKKHALGVGKGGQVTDMFFAVSQVLEIGRDRLDCAAVASADIRTRGLHAGALTAAALARISIEDSVMLCRDRWLRSEVGFQLSGSRLRMASWSDNLFTFGPPIEEAIDRMMELETALLQAHSLDLKPSSKCVIKASPAFRPGRDFVDPKVFSWKQVHELRVLGPVLAATGSTVTDI
ncbi:unnamed protein product, partial [Prorocentrum cordatum]